MEPIDRVGLPPERLAAIRSVLTSQATLADVVRWSARAAPPRRLVDVIVQDEYTHDVVLDHGDGLFLVYDTT